MERDVRRVITSVLSSQTSLSNTELRICQNIDLNLCLFGDVTSLHNDTGRRGKLYSLTQSAFKIM